MVYLNDDDYNVNITGPNPINDSGFVFNFPLSLDPGDSFEGTLFTVALPTDLPIGIYNGFFTITGGADPYTLNMLAAVDFQINAVPEPGTWVLLITGLGILAAMTLNCRHMSHESAT